MTTEILLALLAVFAGAVIQGSIGFGFSLTAVPTLAFLRPEAVPVTLLCLRKSPRCSPFTQERVNWQEVA